MEKQHKKYNKNLHENLVYKRKYLVFLRRYDLEEKKGA